MDSTPQGWYKENDFKEKNMAAIGVAVCDGQGQLLVALSTVLRVCTVQEAEVTKAMVVVLRDARFAIESPDQL